MIDMSLVNAWIQDRMREGKNKKNLMEFLDFRVSVSEHLLYEELSDEDDDSDYANDETPPLGRRPLPCLAARKHKAAHMPRMIQMRNAARCRNPPCKTGKTRVMCTKCKVFLCLNICFEAFHR
jgi:hypothetical protein